MTSKKTPPKRYFPFTAKNKKFSMEYRFQKNLLSVRNFSTEDGIVKEPISVNDGKPVMTGAHFTRNEKGEKVYPKKLVDLIDQVMSLNMGETVLLVDLLQERLGITEAELRPQMAYAPMPQQVPQAAPEAAPEAPVEPKKEEPKRTSFNVKLTAVTDANKIKILKVIRTLKKGMSLPESKALIDNLPSILGENVPTEEAEEKWKKAIEEVGGTVELY